MISSKRTSKNSLDSLVQCPECGAKFEVETILRETIERDLRESLTAEIRDRTEMKLTKKIEQTVSQKYQQEIIELEAKARTQLRQKTEALEEEKAESLRLREENTKFKKSQIELKQTQLKLQELEASQEESLDVARQEARLNAQKEFKKAYEEKLSSSIKQAVIEKETELIEKIEKEQKIKEKELSAQVEEAQAEAIQLREENASFKKSQLELKQTKLKLQEIQDLMDQRIEIARQESRMIVQQELSQVHQERLDLAVKQAVSEKDVEIAEKRAKEQQLKAQVNELQQKLEQGSIQLQGEGLELAIEETLRKFYPLDYVNEIKKGQHGADISQIVINSSGMPCGKILYEAKRAKNWSKDWLDKLRHDGLAEKADILILVSTVLPEGVKSFQQLDDNLFVCQYHEIGIVTGLLRNTLMKVYAEKSIQDNRLTVRDRLADYLISDEFLKSFRLIWDGYKAFQDILGQEERTFKRQMAAKRKSLERILEAQASITGTIEAIGRNPISDRILEQAVDFYLSDDDTSVK